MIYNKKRFISSFLLALFILISCSTIYATNDLNDDDSSIDTHLTDIMDNHLQFKEENIQKSLSINKDEKINNNNSNIRNSNISNTNILNSNKSKVLKSGSNGTAVSSASQLKSTGTFYLTNDITISNKFELSGSFILDGNGHTVTIEEKFKADDFKGTIYIYNTVFTGSETIELKCGDVLIDNCTFTNYKDTPLKLKDSAKNPLRSADDNVIVKNCIFDGCGRGAISVSETKATIESCEFRNCNVYDGILKAKRCSVITSNINFTNCNNPIFYSEKGGFFYLQNVLIDGVNQTNRKNTSNAYKIEQKNDEIGGIILPSLQTDTHIKITASNTHTNQLNQLLFKLIDEYDNSTISDAIINITIEDTDNEEYSYTKITDNSGNVYINHTSPFEGTVTVTAKYDGNPGYYSQSYKTSTYTVSKTSNKDNVIIKIIAPNSTNVENPVNFEISLIDINGNLVSPSNLTVRINNTIITTTNSSNKITGTYTPHNEGIIIINASFTGNNQYEATNNSKTVIVKPEGAVKLQTTINTIDDMDGSADGFFKGRTTEMLPIKFKVIDSNGNEVNEGTLHIMDLATSVVGQLPQRYECGSIDLSTGTRIFYYNTVSHPIGASIAKRMNVIYEGNENYEDSNGSFIISITRASITQKTNLSLSASDTIANVNNEINVSLASNGNGLANQKIRLIIDGQEYNVTTDNYGNATFTGYSSSISKYDVEVVAKYDGNMTSNYFASIDQSTTFDVKASGNTTKTTVDIVDVHDGANDGIIKANMSSQIPIQISVKDESNNEINVGVVDLLENGTIINTLNLTQSNTMYYNPLTLNINNSLNKTFDLIFNGENYESSNNTFTMIITRTSQTPYVNLLVNATNTTISKTNIITAKLTADDHPISNQSITLIIDGITYQKTTDNQGLVIYTDYSSDIPKTVEVVAKYAGNLNDGYMPANDKTTTFEVTSDNTLKKVHIELIDTHDDENNGRIRIETNELGLIEFKVLDSDGNNVREGNITYGNSSGDILKIDLSTGNNTFVINPLYFKTNSQVKAMLTNLKYHGTSKYENATLSFTTTLIRSYQNMTTHLDLTAENISTGDSSNIIATLTYNNQPIVGEEIIFTIDSQEYYIVTNNKGQAILTEYSSNIEKENITVTGVFEANPYRRLYESSNSTTFNVYGKTFSLNTTINLVDTHDNQDDGRIRINNSQYGQIEFNITDQNGKNVNEGTIKLYDVKNKLVDSIDLSTANRSFYINSLTIRFDSTNSTTYTLKYTGTEEYNDSNMTVHVTFTRLENINTVLTIKATNTTVNNRNEITVTLKTVDGRPIGYEKVSVSIAGKTYNWMTNANGTYTYKSYTYPIPKILTASVSYGGNNTKLYNPSDNTSANFTIFKTNDNIEDYSTSTVFIDNHDGMDDFILNISADKLSEIEFTVVDVNANNITQGNALLYLRIEDNLLIGDNIDTILGILESVDIINITTNNRTFIFNPYKYNITKNMQTNFTIYYQPSGEYRQSLATIKTIITLPEHNANTQIQIDAKDIEVNSSSRIKINLTANNLPVYNEKVTITIDGQSFEAITDVNGQIILNNHTFNTGKTVKITATYMGNTERKLNTSHNSTTFNVNDKKPALNDSKIETKILSSNTENTTIKITVKDKNNGNVCEGNITIKLSDKNITQTLNKGEITLPLTLNASTHTINIEYDGDSTHNPSKARQTVTITKTESKITTTILNNTIENVTLNINVNGKNSNKSITSGVIEVWLNKSNITKLTQAQMTGSNITLKLPALSSGNQNMIINFTGNDKYLPSKKNTQINVIKHNVTLKVEITNITPTNATMKINITDETNKKVTDGKITITSSNNTSREASINSGSVTLTVPLKPGTSQELTINYSGDNKNNPKTQKITVNSTKYDSLIMVNITNTTTDSATLNINVTNKTGNRIAEGNIQILLNENLTIDMPFTKGTLNITIPIHVGSQNLTISYVGNDEYYNSTQKITINTKHQTTISTQTTNITPNKATIQIKLTNEEGKPITNGTITTTLPNGTTITTPIKNKTTTINIPTKPGKQNITITYPGDANNSNTTQKLSINVPKHTSNLTINPIKNPSTTDTTFTGKLTDETGKAIANAQIKITVNNKTQTATTDKNGQYQFTTDLTSGQNIITIKYSGDGNNTAKNIKYTVNASKLNVSIKFDDVIGTIGENITLTAYLTDENSNPVKSGKFLFKVNGLSLKDTGIFGGSGNTKTVEVENGIAKVTLEAYLYIRKAVNITGTYAGTSRYNSLTANIPGKMSIRLRNASIVVTTQEITKQDTNLLLTARVYDITKGKREQIRNYDDNYVVFKVNGITLKDKNGKAIQVKVVNGIAQINYTVPIGLAGKYTNLTDKIYTVTAIFGSAEYYPTARNNTTFKVSRSEISFNQISAIVNNTSRKIQIQAKLQDYHNNMVKGTNTINVKINGLTYKLNNKVYPIKIDEGLVNITLDLPENIKTVRQIMLVTGERVGYLGGRSTSSNITIVN